jgi:cell shape-determining protein MreC
MTRKRTNLSRGMLFTWGILAGLIFLFAPRGLAGRLQLTYAQVFRLPLAAGRALTLASRAAPQTEKVSRREYEALLQVRRQLENDRDNLRAQLEEAHQRIDQLAGLRVNSAWESMVFQPADVIVMTGQAQNELVISRGQKEGVAVGQYVMSLSDHSIIGTVSAVSPRGATVMLTTDPESRIPVYITDANLPGIMEGRGGGVARISSLPERRKIRAGDRVYIQKKAGLLDTPIIAGQVTQCRRDPENPVVLEALVQPVCDVANLRAVAVVVSTTRAH